MDKASREINGAEVTRQRALGSEWKYIAEEVFHVNPRKLYEWRQKNPNPNTNPNQKKQTLRSCGYNNNEQIALSTLNISSNAIYYFYTLHSLSHAAQTHIQL